MCRPFGYNFAFPDGFKGQVSHKAAEAMISNILSMGMQNSRPRHQCPDCKFIGASRSVPRGIVERLMASMIHVRPYRCAGCDRRFYSKQSSPVHSAR